MPFKKRIVNSLVFVIDFPFDIQRFENLLIIRHSLWSSFHPRFPVPTGTGLSTDTICGTTDTKDTLWQCCNSMFWGSTCKSDTAQS